MRGCGSVVVHVLGIQKAPGSILGISTKDHVVGDVRDLTWSTWSTSAGLRTQYGL